MKLGRDMGPRFENLGSLLGRRWSCRSVDDVVHQVHTNFHQMLSTDDVVVAVYSIVSPMFGAPKLGPDYYLSTRTGAFAESSSFPKWTLLIVRRSAYRAPLPWRRTSSPLPFASASKLTSISISITPSSSAPVDPIGGARDRARPSPRSPSRGGGGGGGKSRGMGGSSASSPMGVSAFGHESLLSLFPVL